MNKKAFIWAAALLATPAWAADWLPDQAAPAAPVLAAKDIVNANNQVALDFAAARVDYLETVNGPFDSEKGWVPGLTVSAALMQNMIIDNLYLYGQYKLIDGHTDYTGAVQGNPYGSLRQSDEAKIYNEDFRAGEGFILNDSFVVTPYLGAGARQWSRNLPGAGGYHEDYSNGYVGGGLLAQFAPIHRLVLSANGLIGSTLDASMSTSTNGGARIIPATFRLGAEPIYMLGASVDYAITPTIHANAGVDYESFKYGRSAIVSAAFEPGSRTSQTTLQVGLGYAF